MATLPEYACAVIEDGVGRLLLQLRPQDARVAADQLTCFGGRREGDEDAITCLVRELGEELDWAPQGTTPCCDLWRGERFIARFFRAHWDGRPLRTEPGHAAVWVPWPALPALPISPWHAAVLAAVTRGTARVDLAVAPAVPPADPRPR